MNRYNFILSFCLSVMQEFWLNLHHLKNSVIYGTFLQRVRPVIGLLLHPNNSYGVGFQFTLGSEEMKTVVIMLYIMCQNYCFQLIYIKYVLCGVHWYPGTLQIYLHCAMIPQCHLWCAMWPKVTFLVQIKLISSTIACTAYIHQCNSIFLLFLSNVTYTCDMTLII